MNPLLHKKSLNLSLSIHATCHPTGGTQVNPAAVQRQTASKWPFIKSIVKAVVLCALFLLIVQEALYVRRWKPLVPRLEDQESDEISRVIKEYEP
ncbi:hypothetical protein PoB_005151500 [Plakobranchus ocellatus]|uniref:Uncharacterized protein n=1 Tax=Plakobranchus ocellatus TaxID=259542 RepID=A0AAV4C096_9GAST|nr:hypothetical protein PoB_005151500 [Plakobranchus ocellatus]